jgi:cell division GTPase FtsZ
MRVLIVGLGGAGCRILEHLYAHDSRGGTRCIAGVAVDRSADALNSLKLIPPGQRIFSQPFDPGRSDDLLAHIPVEEIIARLQALDDGDIDAVLITAGLGGTMADTAPEIVASIRNAMVEPVFGLLTLPCRSEGPARSVRAAGQLDHLIPLLDGIVLYDNETWRDKVVGLAFPTLSSPTRKNLESILSRTRAGLSPDMQMKLSFKLNEVIASTLSLVFRAGEFAEKGTDTYPEVVLDAGEILNTIQGMGFITIGYARELVEDPPRDLLSRFRPGTLPVEESHKKASRVVRLAKSAISEEISTPGNLEDAKKALILIAGPSREMSMRGYMTVRKWIDRSIRGPEVRAGDFPDTDTRYLAVLVILAGMETLPRVEELRILRKQAQESPGKEMMAGNEGSVPANRADPVIGGERTVIPGQPSISGIHRPGSESDL